MISRSLFVLCSFVSFSITLPGAGHFEDGSGGYGSGGGGSEGDGSEGDGSGLCESPQSGESENYG